MSGAGSAFTSSERRRRTSTRAGSDQAQDGLGHLLFRHPPLATHRVIDADHHQPEPKIRQIRIRVPPRSHRRGDGRRRLVLGCATKQHRAEPADSSINEKDENRSGPGAPGSHLAIFTNGRTNAPSDCHKIGRKIRRDQCAQSSSCRANPLRHRAAPRTNRTPAKDKKPIARAKTRSGSDIGLSGFGWLTRKNQHNGLTSLTS